jgi:hypothetical protein
MSLQLAPHSWQLGCRTMENYGMQLGTTMMSPHRAARRCVPVRRRALRDSNLNPRGNQVATIGRCDFNTERSGKMNVRNHREMKIESTSGRELSSRGSVERVATFLIATVGEIEICLSLRKQRRSHFSNRNTFGTVAIRGNFTAGSRFCPVIRTAGLAGDRLEWRGARERNRLRRQRHTAKAARQRT